MGPGNGIGVKQTAAGVRSDHAHSLHRRGHRLPFQTERHPGLHHRGHPHRPLHVLQDRGLRVRRPGGEHRFRHRPGRVRTAPPHLLRRTGVQHGEDQEGEGTGRHPRPHRRGHQPLRRIPARLRTGLGPHRRHLPRRHHRHVLFRRGHEDAHGPGAPGQARDRLHHRHGHHGGVHLHDHPDRGGRPGHQHRRRTSASARWRWA